MTYLKKTFLTVIAFLAITSFALAAPLEETATPPGQVKKEDIKDKIEDLKERLATRVAELRAKSKRAFFGQIKEKRGENLVLVRGEKEITISTDDETIVIHLDPTRQQTAISLEALEVGERIVAFGTLDLDQKTLVAKKILARILPKNIHGKVAEVDNDAGTLTVTTNKGGTFVIDYEIRTKCQMFQKGESLVNCGLSKINIGDRVFVHGEASKKEDNRLTALRILLLPSKPTTPSPTPTAIPNE